MTMPKYTSWGRTRRPKTLAGRDDAIASKETAAAVAVIAVGDLNDNLNDATAGHNGYTTENQRFLHVYVKHGSAQKSVEIFGYNYAFGTWAPLQIRVDVDNAAAVYATATATTGGSGEARLYIFDIAGIDRVAFVSSAAPTTTLAACTTF